MYKNKKIKLFILSLSCMAFCINTQLFAQQNDSYMLQQQKMDRFLQFLKFFYVDSVDFNKIVEKGTVEMLKELDPHSIYIPKAEVTRTNEPLQGNFEGIGVQFQIMKDTLVVVQPI